MFPVKDTTLERAFAPVTTLLILATIALYIADLRLSGGLQAISRVSPLDARNSLVLGSPGLVRLHASIILSGFMHTGVLHLALNLVFLSAFAPAVERTFGWVPFSVFFIAAIVCAFYTHAIVNPHLAAPVVGSSGAVAAVMGAYLVLRPTGRILTLIPLLPSMDVVEVPSLIFILVWLALQILPAALTPHATSHVAWFTHIGGFLFGLVAGVNLRISGRAKR
ncbi:MAG TPA: rhomboid family intramembrane serine protease [Deltaproteobacteria bacterium]|nr:rhomboid family intramembrane serine protease [Deltaproteobacteria bacterium]HPP80666.1 rhomboid family intramembrane serine protease [Deltaproteobacteria bacterium]